MTTSTLKSLGSEAVTQGIRIRVQPGYRDSHSDPEGGRFLFTYHITIVNESDCRVRLRSRAWIVVDADGQRHEVNGPGVVGQHPSLAPGEQFEYSSYCPLSTSWGTMEGHFDFEREDGSTLEAQIARFYFAST